MCLCAYPRVPCSVSTWCCVHGFQALIHVLPKKKGRCVVRVFSRRSGAKVNPYPNLNAPPGHLPMRFDERETTHPVLPELDLAVVREKIKKTPTLHLWEYRHNDHTVTCFCPQRPVAVLCAQVWESVKTWPPFAVWVQVSMAGSNGLEHCSPKLKRVQSLISALSQATRICCFLVICFADAVALDLAALSAFGCLCPSAG